ncbi:MAG: sodium:solute symporter family protein [Burkholderiaceae bacterium]
MIDLFIVAAFVIFSVAVGFRSRRQASQSLSEYFLAGRSISGTKSGLSMAATQFAADTPLLVMGLIAVGGVFSLWRLWAYGLAFLVMGFVLAAPWRRAGVLTDAELVSIRYSGRATLALRGLKAIYYGTVINCVVMAFVLVAATRIFEVFLPWHSWLPGGLYEQVQSAVSFTGLAFASGVTGLPLEVATTNNVLSMLVMLGFVALYSTTGGLRSVIATDVAQLGLMLLGTAVYAWFALDKAGGLANLPENLVSVYGDATAERFLSFAPSAQDALMPFLVIVSLQWFFQMNSDGTGYLAQRTMACKNHREARLAAIVFTMTQVIVRSLLWLLIGLALLVVYPFEVTANLTEAQIGERELTFVLGIDELLPAGARGLMLTAMLAALASTLDTHLNWGASYWSNDLYKAIWVERVRRRQAGARELLLVARLSNLVILGIALLIMVNLNSIQTAWQMSLLFGAGTGAVLVLRWLWERVNVWSEIVAILISIIIAPILILTVADEWLRLLIMSGASLAAVVLSALLLPATNQGDLIAFYRQVKPPGVWSRTAAAAGDDARAGQRALRQNLIGVIACAISVYCWLVGMGRLLVQSGSDAVNIAFLILGVVAVPFWIRAIGDNEAVT